MLWCLCYCNKEPNKDYAVFSFYSILQRFLKKHIIKRPETESTLVGVKRLNNFLFFNLYVSMPHKVDHNS